MDSLENIYTDRTQAGQLLAEELLSYKGKDTIVLALPRGGVVLGYEVARFLNAPLEVIIAKKITSVSNPEMGLGAISERDTLILDRDAVAGSGISDSELKNSVRRAKEEMQRQIAVFRNAMPLPYLGDKTVILVDDGLATGVTAQAAIAAVREEFVEKIIFAAPVCSVESAKRLGDSVNDIVCLSEPVNLRAISIYYKDFGQVEDEEVLSYLEKARKNRPTDLFYAQ